MLSSLFHFFGGRGPTTVIQVVSQLHVFLTVEVVVCLLISIQHGCGKSAGYQKMLLTNAIHKAERQMDDRDVDSLNKTLSDLATLFDDFDRAQDSYVSSLEDSDRIEAA